MVQAGNFTVSGSTIDFGTAVASTSTNDFIFHYGTGLITTPADDTVSTAKISANAVTGAKLNNDIISAQTELSSAPADTDEFLISDAGTLKRIDYSLIKGGSNAPRFFAFKSSTDGSQSITQSTNTKVTFPSELHDDDNVFASSTFTVPSGKAGFYFIGLKVRDDFQDGVQRTAKIFKNGSELSSTREQNYQTTRHATFDSGIFELAVSDTIEGYIFHAGTTARNIDGTDNFQTAIYGFYLGA